MIQAEIKSNTLGTMLFDSAFPKTDYNTKEQKTNAEGVPLWSIQVLVRQPGARMTENMNVTIPANVDPSEKVEPFTPIAFLNMRVMTGQNNGKTWVSFSADGIGNPSSK